MVNIPKGLSNAAAFRECSFDRCDVVHVAWFSNFCQERRRSNEVRNTYAKVTRVAWRSRCENVWLRDISRRINGVIFLFNGTVLTTITPSSTACPSPLLYTSCTLFYFIASALTTQRVNSPAIISLYKTIWYLHTNEFVNVNRSHAAFPTTYSYIRKLLPSVEFVIRPSRICHLCPFQTAVSRETHLRE